MPSRRPTSTDVAREAGVSRSTVSYVLNNDPRQRFPPSTRERVFAAAAKLGYTPSAAARALRSGRSDLVLCMLPDWPIGPQVGALLEQLSDHLERRDLTLLVHPRVHSKRSTTAIWKSIGPAAVLLLEPVDDEEVQALRGTGAAVVNVSVTDAKPGGPYQFAEEGCGRLQLQHLAVVGHRRIGYAYPDDGRLDMFAAPRLQGVTLACAELDFPEPDVRTVALHPVHAGAAVDAWRSNGVTAVCAYNDEVAVAVLSGAQLVGVRVPEDLAVIGVDDLPAGLLTVPPLTTVSRDVAAYADSIAEAVRRAIDGKAPSRRWPHSDVFDLVIRRSA